MGVVMAAPTTTAHAVACPALDAGPGYGDEQYDDRKWNCDHCNVEHVAKRVVRRSLFERLRLLNDGDQHHTSGVALSSKLAAWPAGVNRAADVSIR